MLGGDIAVDPVPSNLYVVSGRGDKQLQILKLTPDMKLVSLKNRFFCHETREANAELPTRD
jgi:hypothetical protein